MKSKVVEIVKEVKRGDTIRCDVLPLAMFLTFPNQHIDAVDNCENARCDFCDEGLFYDDDYENDYMHYPVVSRRAVTTVHHSDTVQ